MTYRVVATFAKSTTTVKTIVEAEHVIEAEKKAEKKVKSMFTEDEHKLLGEMSINCRRMKE